MFFHSNFVFCYTDFQGEESTRTLTVRQLQQLPENEKVVLDFFNTTGQPYGDEGALFSRFCRDIGKKFYGLIPIDLSDWKKVDKATRDHLWEGIIKVLKS